MSCVLCPVAFDISLNGSNNPQPKSTEMSSVNPTAFSFDKSEGTVSNVTQTCVMSKFYWFLIFSRLARTETRAIITCGKDMTADNYNSQNWTIAYLCLTVQMKRQFIAILTHKSKSRPFTNNEQGNQGNVSTADYSKRAMRWHKCDSNDLDSFITTLVQDSIRLTQPNCLHQSTHRMKYHGMHSFVCPPRIFQSF